MYQMGATIVKVAENERNPPTILHVGPDEDIKKLGLPNTVLIEPGKVPHMYLLLKGAHYDLAVPKDALKEKYQAKPKESKLEKEDKKIIIEFTCNICEKSFNNDKGRKIHIGKMLKEEIKEKGVATCQICEWIGSSPDLLTSHIQQKHIEQIKRKINKEQTNKCYICGFESSSDKAFQIHTEEIHNQTYYIQKETSVTKSPPTKRVKEHHLVDMDTDPVDIVKQRDEEIINLKSTINMLKDKLQSTEDSMIKGAKSLEYMFKCETCDKEFTHRSSLFKPKKEHIGHIEEVPNSEIHYCVKCDNVFKSKHVLETHTVENHKETKSGETVVCVCRYPCIPVFEAMETQEAVMGTQEAAMEAPSRLHTEQEKHVSVDNHQAQKGDGEQPETWQLTGGRGRPKCSICGKTRNTMHAMDKHMKDHEEDDSSFSCGKCDFQSQTRNQLVEHLKKKHDLHTCTSCNVTCASKTELDTHILEHNRSNKYIDNHASHKPCTYYATNECDYNDDECRYNHIKLRKDQHICYTCGNIETSSKCLITHIRKEHGNQPCIKFAKNECRRTQCWFSPNQDFLLPPPRVWHGPLEGAQMSVHKVSEEAQHQIILQATQKILAQMTPILVEKIIESMKI